MFDFLSLKGQKPGYLELSQAIIDAVEGGHLPTQTPLPPSRELADSLEISRDTVLSCYRHLKNLGVTESRGTGGTFVATSARLPADTGAVPPLDESRLSNYAVGIIDDIRPVAFSPDPVIYGAVSKESLPVRRWKLATQKSSESLSLRQLQYEVAVLGRPELRSAVSAYLNRSKGIMSTADEVAVFNLSFTAVVLICRMFLEPGDVIATEDPGFGGAREVARFLSLEVLPVPLDSEGLSVEALRRSRKRPKIVYVTPNHQEPTGTTMSLKRRKELLSWAQENKAWIIEDDYDGLFHFGTRMPPSLKSMDTQDNVIFLLSFWQALYPLTTLCCAVLPSSFMGIMQSAKRHTVSLTEDMAQLALADILNDGYLQKYFRKLERELAANRRALMYELKRVFGARVDVPHQTGGLCMMVRFRNLSSARLVNAAQSAGLPLASTKQFYCEPTKKSDGEVQISFAALPEASVRKTVEKFAALLD